MSCGSLSDAVRAAGYAMAMSDELLGQPEPKPVPRAPENPPSTSTTSVATAPSRDESAGSVRTFFTSWAAWA